MVKVQKSCHKAGALKQRNKVHKSTYKSKREQKRLYKNDIKSKINGIKNKIKDKKLRKLEKKQKIQLYINNRKNHLLSTGILESPIVISIISVSDLFPASDIIQIYREDNNFIVENNHDIDYNIQDTFFVSNIKTKSNYHFLIISQFNSFFIHDAINVSDAIWILNDISDCGFQKYQSIFDTFDNISICPVYHFVKSFKQLPKIQVKNYGHELGKFSVISSQLTVVINNKINTSILHRSIPKPYFNKSIHKEIPKNNVHVIGRSITYIEQDYDFGNLSLIGYIRGGQLSANDVVTIPGFGDYNILKIEQYISNSSQISDQPVILSTKTMQFDPEFIQNKTDSPSNDIVPSDPYTDLVQNMEHFFFQIPQNQQQNTMDISDDNNSSIQSDDEQFHSISDNNQLSSIQRDVNEYDGYSGEIEHFVDHHFVQFPTDNHVQIFQIHNYKKSRDYALNYNFIHPVNPGQLVKITLSNVPKSLYQYYDTYTDRITIHRLYPMEDRISVMHYYIHKYHYTPDIFSSHQYLFFCGPRRFKASAIISGISFNHTQFHKILSVVHGEAYIIVTVVAPFTFTQTPVTMFLHSKDGDLTLVGSGHVLPSPSQPFVFLDELVLTGYVVKSHKRTVVVTSMFHDRETVHKFMCNKLVTDGGDYGRILKPVGTHGTMKCQFAKPSFKRQQVYMRLYKPQYPLYDLERIVYC